MERKRNERKGMERKGHVQNARELELIYIKTESRVGLELKCAMSVCLSLCLPVG